MKRTYMTQPWSATQLHALLVAAHDHPLELLSILAIATGMRRAELQGLTWEDVDLDHGQIQVRTVLSQWNNDLKREPCLHPRLVVLTPWTLDLLNKHRQRQRAAQVMPWNGQTFVFCAPSGSPLHELDDILPSFADLRKRAGLPVGNFHLLRTSVISLLLTLQTPPVLIQEMLGFQFCSATRSSLSSETLALHKQAFLALQQAIVSAERREDADENIAHGKDIV